MNFKKILVLISIVTTVSFFGCGGGSSEKAKELLQRILNLVGIPQEIVLTVCQDENRDGICNALELQAKVVIDRGESLDTILQKITNTEEGKYLLETYDPTLPLLLVLRNDGSEYYTAEYTVPFNGLEPQQEEKDLSLLQAMVDAGYLSSEEISAVSEMNNQEQFYETLLRDFEYNLNTLTQNDLSSPRAVLANLREVSEELQTAGIADTLPKQINACNGSVSCVDNVLAPVSEELKIDENESATIKDNETSLTKASLVDKVFYFSYLEEGQLQTEENRVNSDATMIVWENVAGPGMGNSGETPITIEGDKIITDGSYGFIVEQNATHLIIDNYLVDGTFDTRRTYYFNRADAEAMVSSTAAETTEKTLNDLIVGKGYYTVACDIETPHVEALFFDLNKRLTIKWMQEDGEQQRIFDYTIENEELTISGDGFEAFFSDVEERSDRLVFAGGGSSQSADSTEEVAELYSTFYKSESIAEEELNSGVCSEEGGSSSSSETQVDGFSKEMLQNKVGYHLAYTEEDGTQGYAKATFLSDTSVERREMGVAPNGEIVSDETFIVDFVLEDGKMKYDVGDAYYIWLLDSQDDTAWYIIMKEDDSKDGTIERSSSFTFHFSKPENYPESL